MSNDSPPSRLNIGLPDSRQLQHEARQLRVAAQAFWVVQAFHALPRPIDIDFALLRINQPAEVAALRSAPRTTWMGQERTSPKPCNLKRRPKKMRRLSRAERTFQISAYESFCRPRFRAARGRPASTSPDALRAGRRHWRSAASRKAIPRHGVGGLAPKCDSVEPW